MTFAYFATEGSSTMTEVAIHLHRQRACAGCIRWQCASCIGPTRPLAPGSGCRVRHRRSLRHERYSRRAGGRSAALF